MNEWNYSFYYNIVMDSSFKCEFTFEDKEVKAKTWLSRKTANINHYLNKLCHDCIQKSTLRLLCRTNKLEKVHKLVVAKE